MNHWVSEKQKAIDPTRADPIRAKVCPGDGSLPGEMIFLPRWVMIQNSSMTVNEAASADIPFMNIAASDGSGASMVNILPIKMKNGAPGGCGTSSFQAAVIRSLASHQLAVGSIVMKYTAVAMTKTIHPPIILILL